jgi:hypothetical protein
VETLLVPVENLLAVSGSSFIWFIRQLAVCVQPRKRWREVRDSGRAWRRQEERREEAARVNERCRRFAYALASRPSSSPMAQHTAHCPSVKCSNTNAPQLTPAASTRPSNNTADKHT